MDFKEFDRIRKEALASDDIKVVKQAVVFFANSWLCESEDNSYYECILDGSWPTAEEQLQAALDKIRKEKKDE